MAPLVTDPDSQLTCQPALLLARLAGGTADLPGPHAAGRGGRQLLAVAQHRAERLPDSRDPGGAGGGGAEQVRPRQVEGGMGVPPVGAGSQAKHAAVHDRAAVLPGLRKVAWWSGRYAGLAVCAGWGDYMSRSLDLMLLRAGALAASPPHSSLRAGQPGRLPGRAAWTTSSIIMCGIAAVTDNKAGLS